MIDYPYLKELPVSRKTVEVFRGLNRNARIGDGEFCELENLTSDHYPVLATREKRGTVGQTHSAAVLTGGLYVSGVGLYFTADEQVEHEEEVQGALYLLTPEGVTSDVASGLLPGRKSLALMGKRLIIAPDMKWLEVGAGSGLSSIAYGGNVAKGKLTLTLCKMDGTAYQGAEAASTAPASPGNRDLWVDTSQVPHCLKEYKALTQEWITVPTTYVKISGLGEEIQFSEGDGIHISGLKEGFGDLNGCHVVQRFGHGDLVIPGILDETGEQDCSANPVCMERKAPRLDFVVEAGNRLWGCVRDVNEIYACKLGDFTNWNVFSGLSTDSWVGNVGTPGEFTGGINQGGYPVFYKENCKHKIWPSSTGAHQMIATPCNGVEKGSERSLQLLDGIVLYKSAAGVFADDGSGPVKLGEALGLERYQNAIGGVCGRKYYLSMEDSTGKRRLFVYDLPRQLWHLESDAPYGCMIGDGISLYTASSDEVLDLTGQTGTPEGQVSWRAVTGDLVESPERKYISRLTLRMSLEPGSRVDIYARYDHEEGLTKLGTAYGRKLGSFSLPVRPRRCDHLQLELRGKGAAKIYSITKTFSEGSELR